MTQLIDKNACSGNHSLTPSSEKGFIGRVLTLKFMAHSPSSRALALPTIIASGLLMTGAAFAQDVTKEAADKVATSSTEASTPPTKVATPAPTPIPTPEEATTPSMGDGTIMTPEQVMKELGPNTGLGIFGVGNVSYEGKPIAEVVIRYVGQNQTVDKSRIIDMLATKSGGKYSSEIVNRDLERLINKGLVSGMTTVSAEPVGDQVRVVFAITAQQLLGGVGFTGISAFKESDLSEETKLIGGQVLSDKAINTALANLRTYYQEARYPDVVIRYHFKKTERSGFVDLIFDIQEGRETNVVNIDFEGNTHFDSKELRQVMKTKERGWLTWITKSGRIDREQLEDDLAELVTFYRNKGYLRARLANVKQDYFGKGKKITMNLKVTIDEGIKYKVNQIAFGPTKVFTAAELIPGLSLYNGDTYSAKKVADDVTMIRRYYGSRGYADAKVTPDIREAGTTSKGGLIDIVYQVEEGNPYRVGNINIIGNNKSKDYVIRRELPLQSNDPMNSVDLETAQKRLQNLGYYDLVDVSQTSSSRPGYRDVNIEVQEKRTGSLNLGVAFSSIESVYLFAGVTQSNFDLYDWGSFVGGGQRFAVNGRVGFETQDVSVSWVDPWFLDKKLSFGTEIFYSNSSYFSDYYDQQNYGVALSLRKPLGDLDSVKLEYRLERYDIAANGDAPYFFRAQDGVYNRSHVELSYLYDSRDAQIFPRKGGKFEALGGYSGLGGDVKTYNMGINASYYWNLKWDTIFSVNAGMATVQGINQDNDVPIFEREYLGGPYNLRGFRFRDVGPYDSTISGDETMGGQSSFFCQFEYSIPVIEEVRVAFFYDIGFVHEKAFEFKGDAWASDYGIGLRLNLPIGPLAVDYAIPVKTGNAIDKGGQFQFYLNYSY